MKSNTDLPSTCPSKAEAEAEIARLRGELNAAAMDDPAYVGIKNGEIRAFIRDDNRYLGDTAEALAEWVRMGRTVERMPAADALARMKREHNARHLEE